MNPFYGTILGNLIISLGIIFTIFIVKFLKNKLLNYINYITAITVGLLLGIIFLGFIPELIDSKLSGTKVGFFILLGLFIFYILELFLHWHHCHDLNHKDHNCHKSYKHKHNNGILMFGSTLLHNVFHGIVLFGAFGINLSFGITTTLAIFLHSIPQNIVNYVMNYKDEKYSYIAAFGGIFGALLTFPFASKLLENKFAILSIISGGLLYTALADIFPEFKEKGSLKFKIIYLLFIIIGVFLYLGFDKLIEN